MALAVGTRLGPYEVLALIGEGGMGEVYKARDTRLDRTVAIKVLLPGSAADPEQRRRFEQEARAASALNHPHICVVHDVGREGGVDFLVLEYLDGETLAQRLSKGPLPVDEALECATQIVDALDKAHRQGIVHRDLKPSNVLLTRAGAKLLDFGLAKLRSPGASGLADLSLLHTRPSPLTTRGTILGTLAYMSPEQVPLVVVDSVGFLARPGTGSIRYAQPQYSVSRAGDLAYASPLPAASAVVVRVDRVGRRSPIAELPSGFRGSVSLAPDGRRLAVYRTEAQGFTVWTVDVDRGILTRVLGQRNPHAPVWSPDGERLAFSQDHEGTSNLFVQAADGAGTAELLVASAQHDDPGSWSRDGRWIAYTEASSDTDWDLWALDVPAHQARPFRRTPRAQQQPTISPDGHWVAYASNETGTFQVYVEAFPSGGKRIQISPEGGTEPLWTSSGRELIYRNQQRLMSVGVSAGATLSATRPVQVLDAPFLAAATYGPSAYAIAPDGRSFYFIEPKAQPPTPRRINIVLGWASELEKRLGREGGR